MLKIQEGLKSIMQLDEIISWCQQNNIPMDTEVCIDRGIDIIENVDHIVHNGIELVLLPKGYDEEIREND